MREDRVPMNLDGAREALRAKVDRFVFSVDDWSATTVLRDKHAAETIAWTRLEEVLTALLQCFDPLIKVGRLNLRGGPPAVFVSQIAAFRADGRHVDLVRDDYGINFTNQSPGGVLSTREVIERVEDVDQIFGTLARRLEKLIHDEKVVDKPDLRAVISDFTSYAAKLRDPCRALRTPQTSGTPLTPLRPGGDPSASKMMTPHDSNTEREVFVELAKTVEASGWFPAYTDFRTEENHAHLDAMERNSGHHALLFSADGFYVWSGTGLRLMKDLPFFAQELARAADLLDLLKKRFNQKQRDPVSIHQLLQDLGWAEPNAVRRAVYVLTTEFPGALRYESQS